MAKRRGGWTSFWTRLRRGPWPESTLERLAAALDDIERALRAHAEVAALVVFGSYARGDFSRRSDVDLLVLFSTRQRPERTPSGRAVRRAISEAEQAHRLPMHLAPLLASVYDSDALTPTLLHDLWRDAVVLYGEGSILALLRPGNLSPWAVIRFRLRGTPSERVRLSRRLHGTAGRPGILQLPALTLGRGALLVPAAQQEAVRAALDEAGATYDLLPVWREA